MKVTLHIGQSKTGTSAIQAFLTLNRDALLRQKVTYPSVSVWGMPIDMGSHNAVADAIAGKSTYPYVSAKQYKEAFFGDAEKLGANHMILSGEHFFGGEPRVWNVPNEEVYFAQYREKVKRVSEWLSGHETTVLIYLRPHLDWFSSAISQTIRIAGLAPNLDANLDDMGFFNLLKPLLRYNDLLSAWKDILNPAELRIIPYRRDKLIGGSTISDFLHQTGVDEKSLSHGTTKLEVNSSLSRDYLEVKRVLNARALSKIEMRTAAKCLEALSKNSDQSNSYIPDEPSCEAVRDLAEADNVALETSFGIRVEPRHQAIDRPDPVHETQIRTALLRFEREIRTPKYRTLHLSLLVRAMLREKARPAHTLIHQIRRARMARKHRRV